MKDESPPAAVVTGVSSGIGRAIARALTLDGWFVFGSVRTEADAERVADELGESFLPLIFDVTDDAGVKAAAATVEAHLQGRTLACLVNNAGVSTYGPVRYLPLDDLRALFEVNVFGVVRVTQAFLPQLGADRAFQGPPGRIVNISSAGGKLGAPFMAGYAMSKHALEAFSDSLRGELLIHGIDVIVVGPGMVQTPMFEKANAIDLSGYADTEYGSVLERMRDMASESDRVSLEPEAVAALVQTVARARRPKTRYAILKYKLLMWTIPRWMPSRLLDRMMAKRFELPMRKV